MLCCILIGSSYSIISEIEHQLGLRSNKTTPPGQDTLNEEDEKKLFFEALEKGRGSSLDYSELNHQLDGSIRYYVYMYSDLTKCTCIAYTNNTYTMNCA